jgi:uncharacterized protein (TIGR00266 family)
MQYDLNHRPAYTTASVILEPGEALTAESGAMISYSDSISMTTQVGEKDEGFLESVKDTILGGESFFRNTFVAEGTRGVVDVTATKPGDVQALELNEEEKYLQAGSYIASGEGISLDSELGDLDTFLGGEGLSLLKVSGTGTLFLGGFGGIERKEVAAGDRLTVDSGHVIAWDAGMDYATEGVKGYKETMFSGEGFVMRFDGPGEVLVQTRDYDAFIDDIIDRIPSNRGGGAGQQ